MGVQDTDRQSVPISEPKLKPESGSDALSDGLDIRVLIIEDDLDLSELLAITMKKSYRDVDVANDGSSAIARLEEAKPDLVLLDILLPDMNGLEILRYMRERDHWRELPVIVISNFGQPETIEEAMRLGTVDYIIKAQYTLAEIADQVQKIVRTLGI